MYLSHHHPNAAADNIPRGFYKRSQYETITTKSPWRGPLVPQSHFPLRAVPRGGSPPPPGFLRRSFPSFPWSSLPNLLTYARCLAIPFLAFVFYATQPIITQHRPVFLSSIFAIASFTDWLDGYLARRWEVSTPFGAFLDPVADKLMVSTALILLSGKYGQIVALPCSVILAREIAVSALREWMAQRGLRDVVQVGFQGKVKTAATMVAITVLLAARGDGRMYWTGIGGLYFSALITVTSGSLYFTAARPVLMGEEVKDDTVVETKKDAPVLETETVTIQNEKILEKEL